MKKYRVILEAYGNIDHGEDPYENIAPTLEIEADTIEECQKAFVKYRDEHDLGAGNCPRVTVYEGEKEVGSISYNGRFWTKEVWDTL